MNYHISYDLTFKKHTYPGMYIALEGVDGSGKTTQAKSLEKYFTFLGKKVTMTCEPKVDLPGGDIIMSYFNSQLTMPAEAFQYFATANRVINQAQIVIPALKNGDVVITDRCFWSAIPYGLLDKGYTFTKKKAEVFLQSQGLLSLYHQFIAPDILFYIDISPEVAIKRSFAKKGRRADDIYEKEEKLQTIVRGYRWLVKTFPDEFITIDGEKSVEEVSDQLLRNITI